MDVYRELPNSEEIYYDIMDAISREEAAQNFLGIAVEIILMVFAISLIGTIFSRKTIGNKSFSRKYLLPELRNYLGIMEGAGEKKLNFGEKAVYRINGGKVIDTKIRTIERR